MRILYIQRILIWRSGLSISIKEFLPWKSFFLAHVNYFLAHPRIILRTRFELVKHFEYWLKVGFTIKFLKLHFEYFSFAFIHICHFNTYICHLLGWHMNQNLLHLPKKNSLQSKLYKSKFLGNSIQWIPCWFLYLLRSLLQKTLRTCVNHFLLFIAALKF